MSYRFEAQATDLEAMTHPLILFKHFLILVVDLGDLIMWYIDPLMHMLRSGGSKAKSRHLKVETCNQE